MEHRTIDADWDRVKRNMNAVRNYQKELDSIIERLTSNSIIEGSVSDSIIDGVTSYSGLETNSPPRLLLHSCCAPCSSYVLEYLRPFFKITVFYYNPNISMEPEYIKRVAEQKRLIAAYNESVYSVETLPGLGDACSSGMSIEPEDACSSGMSIGPAAAYPIEIIEGDYEPDKFFETVKGLETCPEGGERCFKCYEMRLRKTSQVAQRGDYDYFTTTLTISPLKNAAKLNEIGERLAQEYKVRWLPSDFKKKDGYKRSIELSKEYGLYRQDYCGCVYSRR